MKVNVLREKSIKELQEELEFLHRELFNLRMQRGMEGIKKPHLFSQAKRGVARILTLIKQKEGQSNEI